MKCYLFKWFISSSFDSGKDFPRFVRRHIQRCRACRDFSLFSETLAEKAKEDADTLLRENRSSLNGKILQKISQPQEIQRIKKNTPFLIPILSTALTVLVIFIIILFPIFNPGPISFPDQLNSLNNLFESGNSLQDFAVKIESPIGQEYLSLKNAIFSTRGFLGSCFDFQIDVFEE